MKPAIVVAGYSRHKALSRLLQSLEAATYPDNDIDLIVSLDGGATYTVEATAQDFDFSKGNKKIVKRKNNIGLREHILWCGDLSSEYGSIIVLEDDLFVDKYFYYYAQAALNFYKKEPKIAGIALYSPRYNEFANLPFESMQSSSTGYFMQTTCSWGQAWSAEQWMKFRKWYGKATREQINSLMYLPDTVKKWPESSWKKYFSAYMVENDLYFFYPYTTYTTNCSDAGGTHIKKSSDIHQVPLASDKRGLENHKFAPFYEGDVYYDSFMEPSSAELFSALGIGSLQLEIDIYGIKPLSLLKKKQYALSSRPVKNPIKAYKLGFRPIEKTVLEEMEEKDKGTSENCNLIYLAESKDIKKERQPYYKLANYYSYLPLESKNFIKGYFRGVMNKFVNRVFFNE